MDNYWQQNRLSSYYRAMANAEAKELSRVANSASLMHLKDGFVRMQFQDEISLFIREQLNKLSYAKTEDEFQACLNKLKSERENLQAEDRMLTSGEAKLTASVKVVATEEGFSFTINAVGVVVGLGQAIVGMGLLFTLATPAGVVGAAYGALLVMHGINDAYESYGNIRNKRSDSRGFLKDSYMKSANFLGFDERIGELAYHGATMGLSWYGMTRLVLRPGTLSLFNHMPSDYVRHLSLMSKVDFGGELFTNLIAAKGLYDGFNHAASNENEMPSMPTSP